jgi:uncharacterized membrane protein HdeD (DUF308 family)
MHHLLGHAWWMLALARPGLALAFMVALYAAYAIISGISEAIRHGHDRFGWWAPLLLGLFSVVAGVNAIVLPAIIALVLVMRVNAIAAGAFDVFDLVTGTRSRGRRFRCRPVSTSFVPRRASTKIEFG